ncbi:MAG: DUF4366 domain-containing protein [Clostridia bacterium]|nr:DUF4366 domain-containing protein [Clostridia bacterium]
MKRKEMFRLLACLLAVVMCTTAFSMTAFASDVGAEFEEPPVIEDTEPIGETPTEGTADTAFQIPEEYLSLLEGIDLSGIDLDAIMDTVLSFIGGMGDVSEEERSPGQVGTVTTNGARLNVRTGAGLGNRAFTQLENGETVDVIGTDGEWVMVLLPERIGYVHSDYLTVTDKPTCDSGADTETPSFSLDFDMLAGLLDMFGGMFGDLGETGGNSNALTPDGNMTLIDDIGSSEESGKQFITVQTKNGNVFYLIIDRDDEGEYTVHFLNQVDEADLMALMEDGETETEPVVCSCSDKCAAGAIKTDCALCMANMTECAGVEPKPQEPTEPTDPEPPTDDTEDKGGNGAMIAVVLLILAGGGGAAFYFLVVKKKGKTTRVPSEIDDFDLEDEEYLIEEDTDTDTTDETEDIE